MYVLILLTSQVFLYVNAAETEDIKLDQVFRFLTHLRKPVNDENWKTSIEEQLATLTALVETQTSLIESQTSLIKTLMGSCDDDYTKFEDQCYKYHGPTNMDWPDATAACDSEGGHLAEPRTQEQNDFIHELAERKYVWIKKKY